MKVNAMRISVKLLDCAVLPEYGTQGSAGFDFVANKEVVINPFATELIPTGICVSLPEGFEIQVRPRSGLSSKTKLRVANSPGTIDSDFRGPIMVIMENTGNVAHVVRKGDKIAQGVITPYFVAAWNEVDKLETSGRGENGFGSTDSKT